MSKLPEIFCICYPWPWLGPRLTTMRYFMYFTFSHNRADTDIDLESTTYRIIHCDSPCQGVVAKLHTRVKVCYPELPCLFCGSRQALLTLGTAASGASTSVSSLQNKHLDRVKVAEGHSRMRLSSVGSKSSVAQRTVVDFTTAEEQRRLKNQLSSPFSRQDIFYSGSVINLHEYKTSSDMITYVKVISSSTTRQTHKGKMIGITNLS